MAMPRCAAVWLMVASVAWLALLMGCNDSEAAGTPRGGATAEAPRAVTLTPVVVRPLDRSIELTGTLFGEEDVTIAAVVPGRVVDVKADLGDVVAHGGTLAIIDPVDYALAVDEARMSLLAALSRVGLTELPEGEIDLDSLPLVMRAIAQESNAAARLDRARRLYERQPPLLSEQDYADIETQREVAKTVVASERLAARALLADARVRASSLRQAEQRLRDTRVSAPAERPLSYRIAARFVSVGEVVTEGQSLFRLVATDRVKFRGQAPERAAREITVGALARLSIDGFSEPFEATVTRVAPAVDIETRSFAVEIDAANPDGLLKPGSFTRARIRTRVDPAVRLIPETAIVRFAGVQRVFSVRDGVLAEHRVTLGEAAAGMVEVLDLPSDVGAVVDRPVAGLVAGAAVKAESSATTGG
jgi:RND family efflux transporter MFP subunit